ncbi:MAG TPA: hypothetical protein VN794_04775, partial [Methylomirabilota bacterium]|nr:hypothetical protein [Methylomirabilota bacterium]
GDVPAPALHIGQAGNQAVLNWPYGAAGFALETTPGLPGASWTNVIDPIEIVGDQNVLTNPPAQGTRFYRLHRMP